MTPAPGTPAAALVALVGAILDALAIFGVIHLTPEERTILVGVLTTALAAAGLLVPVFQHNHAMNVMRLRSADPAIRAREAGH